VATSGSSVRTKVAFKGCLCLLHPQQSAAAISRICRYTNLQQQWWRRHWRGCAGLSLHTTALDSSNGGGSNVGERWHVTGDLRAPLLLIGLPHIHCLVAAANSTLVPCLPTFVAAQHHLHALSMQYLLSMHSWVSLQLFMLATAAADCY
jgi:hypothetical protein